MLRQPHDPRDKDKRDIAARQKRQLRAAIAACGEAKSYGRWSLTDNLGLEVTRFAYCCRREGVIGWTPTVEQAFGELVNAAIDEAVSWPLKKRGWSRYSVGWSSVVDYNPVPENVLAERRAKKKAKKERNAKRKAKKQAPKLFK